MKAAFSLLELVFAIVILSFVFSSASVFYRQIYKNYETLELFERLYGLEKRLFYHSGARGIVLQTDELKDVRLDEKSMSDGLFEFKKLDASGQGYEGYFYDEKGL